MRRLALGLLAGAAVILAAAVSPALGADWFSDGGFESGTDGWTLSSGVPQAILDNADKARISRELVRLKNDVPMTESLDDLVLRPPDGPKLIAFLKAMEFTSLTRRVAEATGTDIAAIEPASVQVDGTDVHGPDMGAGAPPAAAASGCACTWPRCAISPAPSSTWSCTPRTSPSATCASSWNRR